MKKVLLAFDGSNFSEGAFEFARRLNDIEPILLTGVFVPQVDYANLWSYAAAASNGAVFVPALQEEDEDQLEKSVQHFEDLCQKNDIAYRVHKDYLDFALPELKKETRFSDVMIVSGELFYKGVLLSNQYDYLKDALHAAECPVLIVPENYEFPANNILTYDGSEESVYAIKEFAYIFPELAKNPTLLVYAANDEEKDFPSKSNIEELATQHYKDITLYKIDVNPRKYFASWIGEKKASILISGSFSRSSVSQMFKRSFVADIISDHRLPVFIAHRK